MFWFTKDDLVNQNIAWLKTNWKSDKISIKTNQVIEAWWNKKNESDESVYEMEWNAIFK